MEISDQWRDAGTKSEIHIKSMKSIEHMIVAGADHGQNWEVKSEVNLVFAAKQPSLIILFLKGVLLNDSVAAPNICHIRH